MGLDTTNDLEGFERWYLGGAAGPDEEAVPPLASCDGFVEMDNPSEWLVEATAVSRVGGRQASQAGWAAPMMLAAVAVVAVLALLSSFYVVVDGAVARGHVAPAAQEPARATHAVYDMNAAEGADAEHAAAYYARLR
jgi:hypothetical protein